MFTFRLANLIAGLFVLLMPAMLAAGQKKQNEPTKEEVLEAEQRLSELGYWTGPVDGLMDSASRQALIAFQKVERRKRTGRLTNDELFALRAAERPTPRDTGPAHIEIDIGRQVLFYVDETGKVVKVLPVSTGNGRPYNENGQKGMAHTPSGTLLATRFGVAAVRCLEKKQYGVLIGLLKGAVSATPLVDTLLDEEK